MFGVDKVSEPGQTFKDRLAPGIWFTSSWWCCWMARPSYHWAERQSSYLSRWEVCMNSLWEYKIYILKHTQSPGNCVWIVRSLRFGWPVLESNHALQWDFPGRDVTTPLDDFKPESFLEVLVDLGSTNLDFSSETTMKLFKRLALQAGPSCLDQDTETLRQAHIMFTNVSFCQGLAQKIHSSYKSQLFLALLAFGECEKGIIMWSVAFAKYSVLRDIEPPNHKGSQISDCSKSLPPLT